MVNSLIYQEAARITFVDPNLFIINRLPAYAGQDHHFYLTHKGEISPKLFTITPSLTIAKAATLLLSQLDFSSPECMNRFAYMISTGLAFANKTINSSKYILTQPNASEPVLIDKLYALDFFGITDTPETRQIFELREALIKKAGQDTLASTVRAANLYRAFIQKGKSVLNLTTNHEIHSKKIKSTEVSSGAQMTPLLISYHTDSPGKNYYRKFADRLRSTCTQFGIRHDIAELQPQGEYSVNCLLKPAFILQKLIEHKEPVIWMDCDTELKEQFSEFNNILADIGMATHSGRVDGVMASPLVFNYTPGSFRVVREWAVHCQTAIKKGIIELDHDALKHYVLPALDETYTLHLLSKNWNDFVNGRYLVNGNSAHANKNEIFNQVNSLTDRQRWGISANVECYTLIFESTNESVFKQAYEALSNFSNAARLKFYFNKSLAKTNSTLLKQLIIETGEKVFFDKIVKLEDNEIIMNIDPSMEFEKNWDSLCKP